MSRFLFSIFLFVFFSGLYPANSQELKAIKKPISIKLEALSLKELVKRIQSKNPELLALKEAMNEAQQEKRKAESNLWPKLSLNGQFSQGTSSHMTMLIPRVRPGNMSMQPAGPTANANATLSYPIYRGDTWAHIQREQARYMKVKGEYEEAVRLKVYQGKTQYLNILYQQALLKLNSDFLRTQQEYLRLTKERFKIGKVPRYYILRFQSEIAKIVQEKNTIELDIEVAKLELAKLMGKSSAQPFYLKDSISNRLVELPMSYKEALKKVLENNPTLAILKSKLSIAKENLNMAQSMYFPFVYLVGVYDQRFPEREQFRSGYALDLLVTFPLFDGWNREAEIAKFKSQYQQIQFQMKNLENAIAIELAQIYKQLTVHKTNFLSSQTEIDSVSEEVKISRLRYENGKGIIVELFDANNREHNAYIKQLHYLLGYQQNLYKVEKLH